ncbi:MAG: NAD-dependent epimerase/dehydratase family protein, partial [Sphingobacteriales bacterium]
MIAQPFKKNNLSTKNSGWILVERSNFSKVFKTNRKTIDSLTKLGYQIHDFNLGFNLIDLKDTSNPQVYYEVNFELTKRLFDVFIKSDAKKFIFISSVKAAADSKDGVLTEDVQPNPQTDYG